MVAIRIPSVQKVLKREEGTEYLSLYIEYFDRENNIGTGVWRSSLEFQKLNEECLPSLNISPLTFPSDPKSLLVNAEKRADLEDDLIRALEESNNHDALLEFLGVSEKSPSSSPSTTSSTDKAFKFLVHRARSRALLSLVPMLKIVQKRVGLAGVGLFISAVLATLFKSKTLQYVFTGIFAGAGACSIMYEQAVMQAVQRSIEDSSKASAILKKKFSENDAGSDEKDVKLVEKICMSAVSTSSQRPDENVDPEEVKKEMQEIIEKIDELDGSHNHLNAYETCKGYLEKHADQPYEILWRLARAAYMTSERIQKESGLKDPKRLAFIEEAHEVTSDLVETFPNEAFSHKYHAMCCTSIAEHKATKDKIVGGYQFRDHTLRAIELAPEDATLHYMLGRFQFEVAKLSYMERKLAKAVFGQEPPTTTYQEAIQSYEKAKKLRESQGQTSLPSELEIARCYISLKDKKSAKEILTKLANMTNSTDPYDINATKEAKELLNKI